MTPMPSDSQELNPAGPVVVKILRHCGDRLLGGEHQPLIPPCCRPDIPTRKSAEKVAAEHAGFKGLNGGTGGRNGRGTARGTALGTGNTAAHTAGDGIR